MHNTILEIVFIAYMSLIPFLAIMDTITDYILGNKDDDTFTP